LCCVVLCCVVLCCVVLCCDCLAVCSVESGLAVPQIEQWPSATGYTFATWIRIESYTHPLPSAIPKRFYQPTLFRFMTEHGPHGVGVECVFDSERLTVRVAAPKQARVQFTMDYVLKPKRWYHLVITQTVPPRFGYSELRMYVDGKLQYNSAQLLPKLKPVYPHTGGKPMRSCFIGTDSDAPFYRTASASASLPAVPLSNASASTSSSAAAAAAAASASISASGASTLPTAQPASAGAAASSASATKPHALYGQLGPIYLFDDALSAKHVETMYWLGPSYMFTFAIDGGGDSVLQDAVMSAAAAGSAASDSPLNSPAQAQSGGNTVGGGAGGGVLGVGAALTGSVGVGRAPPPAPSSSSSSPASADSKSGSSSAATAAAAASQLAAAAARKAATAAPAAPSKAAESSLHSKIFLAYNAKAREKGALFAYHFSSCGVMCDV
jgi:hypothetical protein